MSCVSCAKPGKHLCSKCKGPRYCGTECQKKHWKSVHKFECQCAICYVGLTDAVKLPCGHFYHADCVEGLKSFSIECPLCEKDEFTTAYVSMKSQTPDFKAMEDLAEKGDVRAQYYLAVLFRSMNATSKVLQWCTKAAEQGHSAAQNELAFMYHHGDGADKDDEKAFFWTRKAADQGVKDAQKNLANHYFFGEGCAVDKKLAAKYYELAKDKESCYNLGVMYLHGNGLERDDKKAMEWFYRAGDHEWAQFTLGVMFAKGNVKENQVLSAKFFQKASGHGNAQAQFNLGLAYLEGRGVEQSLETAVYWNMRSAAQGLADAQFQLGLFCQVGRGIEKDEDKATEWFKLAAEQGLPDAQFWYGRKLFEKNADDALLWIIRAAEKGHEMAQIVMDEVEKQAEETSERKEKG